MFIINQDRDEIIQRGGNLYTAPAFFQGNLMGLNIYQGNHFLGTFDSVKEAMQEMSRIVSFQGEYCFISGYRGDDDEPDAVAELLEAFKHEMVD